MSAAPDTDLDFEARDGVSGRLPPGERVLWQGAPDWRALAVSAFHVRKVAIYFAVLIVLVTIARADEGAATLALSASWLAVTGAVAVGLLALLARFYASSSVYTLTTRRLVIRSGLALPVTFNLPLAQVARAAVSAGRGGAGNLSFTVVKPNRVALLAIWPHARPWALAEPEPTLRAIRDVEQVAKIAAQALREAAGQVPMESPPVPAVASPRETPTLRPAAGMAAA